ncbi:MAG TPA: FAD-dependent oxidoreductase, partial [Gemmatimonadales bacterium]|nr:FAD-dependent oxidoreductase [Gemmatimonadales bacterium]
PGVVADGDFVTAMRRMRRLRAELSPADSARRFADLGVDVFLGEGRFTGPDRVVVGDATLRFRRAVIATGARAAVPTIPGIEESGYLTNETVFSLTRRPEKLIVIGGGPIGCELAQSFARLGSAVTVLDRQPGVLPRDDAEAGRIVGDALRADGVTLELGVELQWVVRERGITRVGFVHEGRSRTVEGDTLLVAAGRAPNVLGLGLELAGVRYDPRRGVAVDDRLRTTNRRIYAIGDVASRYQFTHAADSMARLVLGNALFFGRSRASQLLIPWTTYTSPEVAQVGLTVQEAERQGLAIETVTVPLREVDRAVLAGETAGFLRVNLHRGTDRIAGVTVVAAHAGELIGEAALAMTGGLGLGTIGRTIHPYPTVGEAYRKAADLWRRRKLTPLVRRVLGWWFRLFR